LKLVSSLKRSLEHLLDSGTRWDHDAYTATAPRRSIVCHAESRASTTTVNRSTPREAAAEATHRSWTHVNATTSVALLRQAVSRWPDKTFVTSLGESYTFAAFDSSVARLAQGLSDAGVREFSRVATLLDNSADALLVWFAVNRLRAVLVPINTALTGNFLRHQLAQSEATAIVAEAHYARRVAAVALELPKLTIHVVRGLIPASTQINWTELEPLKTATAVRTWTDPQPADISQIIFTSGTTGPSKGCMVSHNQICHLGMLSADCARLRHSDVHWTPLPLFHMAAVAGAIVSSLSIGATVAISAGFSVSRFWEEIADSGATVAEIMSVMFALVASAPPCEAEKACYGQLRTVHGVPVSEQVRRIWSERFGVRHIASLGYAMTEVSAVVRGDVDDPDRPALSSGRRYPDFDVRIVDDGGEECPSGTPGEVILRPCVPNIIFKGYCGDPAATHAVGDDLWLHTGDIGMFDDQGYFFFVDRKKDYLRRGGENISSVELETQLMQHPAIQRVAVHAVPSDMSEDDVKVTAVLQPGAELTEEQFHGWASQYLAKFAVPRYVEFRSELPFTPTGKLEKHRLRSDGVTPATWDSQAPNRIRSSEPTSKEETV
jgi:carnitine-CoA ligase